MKLARTKCKHCGKKITKISSLYAKKYGVCTGCSERYGRIGGG